MEGIQLYLEQLAVICRKEILAIWQDKATRLIIVVPCIILGFSLAMQPTTIWRKPLML